MAGKLVNEGEHDALDILFGSKAVNSVMYLGLYLNSDEPAETAQLIDLTEPVGNGYARMVLTRGVWSVVADLAGYVKQTFIASGGDWGQVYGYFICDVLTGTAGKLWFVEHFSNGPYNATNLSNVGVTPQITAI